MEEPLEKESKSSSKTYYKYVYFLTFLVLIRVCAFFLALNAKDIQARSFARLPQRRLVSSSFFFFLDLSFICSTILPNPSFSACLVSIYLLIHESFEGNVSSRSLVPLSTPGKKVSYHGNDYFFVYAVFAPQKKFREFSSF